MHELTALAELTLGRTGEYTVVTLGMATAGVVWAGLGWAGKYLTRMSERQAWEARGQSVQSYPDSTMCEMVVQRRSLGP